MAVETLHFSIFIACFLAALSVVTLANSTVEQHRLSLNRHVQENKRNTLSFQDASRRKNIQEDHLRSTNEMIFKNARMQNEDRRIAVQKEWRRNSLERRDYSSRQVQDELSRQPDRRVSHTSERRLERQIDSRQNEMRQQFRQGHQRIDVRREETNRLQRRTDERSRQRFSRDIPQSNIRQLDRQIRMQNTATSHVVETRRTQLPQIIVQRKSETLKASTEKEHRESRRELQNEQVRQDRTRRDNLAERRLTNFIQKENQGRRQINIDRRNTEKKVSRESERKERIRRSRSVDARDARQSNMRETQSLNRLSERNEKQRNEIRNNNDRIQDQRRNEVRHQNIRQNNRRDDSRLEKRHVTSRDQNERRRQNSISHDVSRFHNNQVESSSIRDDSRRVSVSRQDSRLSPAKTSNSILTKTVILPEVESINEKTCSDDFCLHDYSEIEKYVADKKSKQYTLGGEAFPLQHMFTGLAGLALFVANYRRSEKIC